MEGRQDEDICCLRRCQSCPGRRAVKVHRLVQPGDDGRQKTWKSKQQNCQSKTTKCPICPTFSPQLMCHTSKVKSSFFRFI